MRTEAKRETWREQPIGNVMGNVGNASSTVDRQSIVIIRGFGAGDRDRTDDIQLGKLSFYH